MPRQPHELFDTPQQKADLEARNGLLQFEAVQKMVAAASVSEFTFTPNTLLELHYLAIQDIYTCAGKFRTGPVYLLRGGTVDYNKHQPPPWEKVEPYVIEMCDYVNHNFTKSAIHLAAYVMWRHNWIHPFFGGNGRVSRAASYYVLCARLGFYLPGTNTIPSQIEQDPEPYYDALEMADLADKKGQFDISDMEKLISRTLAAQLLSVYDQASGKAAT
jgi:Fic family protein